MGLAGVALAAAALLVWAPPVTSGWNQGSAEATVWQLMNGARVNNGRRAVQHHSTLVSLARWRSKDLVQRNYFDHVILGSGHQVYHWYDLNGLQYSWGGENIGWNNGMTDADSPVSIHEGFMTSPGHRANVLEPSFTHGGVGAFAADNVNFLGERRSPRVYTQLFMVAASQPPPPPPPPSNPNPPPPPAPTQPPAAPNRPAARDDGPGRARLHRVDRPAAPSRELDAAKLVAGRDTDPAAALVRSNARFQPAAEAAAATASPLRVEAAAAPSNGLFETVLGSVLGFFL